MAALSAIRDQLEYILNIPSGDAFIDSQNELDLINLAYQKSAYKYNWPHMLKRGGTVLAASVNRYSLPTAWRKFDYVFSEGDLKEETSLENIRFSSHKYAVDVNTSEIILSESPQSASTAYTTSNSETAGASVVIELNSVSGLSAGDEIFVNGTTTPEFSQIQSVDTTNTTITAKLSTNTTAGDKIYLSSQILAYGFYREVTNLSATTDVPLLPSATHYIIPYYAAYLYFKKLEDEARAKLNLEIWTDELNDAWLAHDKISSGASNEFSL